eukprot:4148794-Pyramimonas_sp.AAC.1
MATLIRKLPLKDTLVCTSVSQVRRCTSLSALTSGISPSSLSSSCCCRSCSWRTSVSAMVSIECWKASKAPDAGEPCSLCLIKPHLSNADGRWTSLDAGNVRIR